MKKIFTAVCMFAILLGFVRAQGVDFYSFTAQETGESFVPLSGATTLDKTGEVTGEAFGTTFFNQTESLAHIEDQGQEMAGIPLGFDFKFGGLVYDKFIVVGKGYLLLGGKSDEKVKIPAVTAYQLSLTTYPRIGLACNDGNYGVDGTSISYKLEGSTPNQVLTVEFLNMAYGSDAAGDNLFNYQIKLYESDNHIEFLFDGWTVPDGASDWSIGLRDATEAHFRKLDGDSWSNTIFSTSMQYWAEGSTFVEGLKYSFGLPPACEKPTKTIENITVSSTTDNVDLDIEVSAAGEAEAFLVLASENPIEGTLESRDYQVGEVVNGATVIAREDWDSWTIKWQDDEETIFRISQSELEGNKDYHYAVYLFNYKCTGAAFSDVFTKVVKTQTTAPESLVVNSFSLTDLSFSVEPNALDEDVLIAMTDVKATNKWGDPLFMGDFAVPPADAQPGDTLRKADGSFGGVVLYTGKASDNIECDVDLDYYTVYHFGAFSKRSGEGYSSVFAQDDTITEARVPFDADFGNMISDEMPYGWNGTSGFMVVYGENAVAADLGANSSGDRREVILALPAMDIPDTSNAVLEMSYSFDPYGFDMVEKDSIVFEISKDNGATYEEIKTVTINSSSMYVRRLAIQGYTGVKKALIRIRYVSYSTEAHSLSFSKVQVLPLAFCDVPTSVYVSSIYGENAEVFWTPSLSEEKAWNISYAMKEEDGYTAWTDPVNVTETSYQLSGLYGKTLYGVRVRAVCGVGDVSQWSTVKDFQSGLKPSFIEDFDNMEYYASPWYPGDTTVYLPDGWGDRMRLSSDLKDTLRSSDITYYYDTEIAYDWKTNKIPVAGVSNGALTFKMNGFTTQVVKVPLFGLDGSGNPLFRMKMAFGNMGENGVFETVESTSADYSLHLLISTDGGSTYVVKDALNVWDADGLVAIGDEFWFECDLSKYEGATSILFLAQGVTEEEPTTNHILYVDSVSVINQCAIAKLLQVRNITDTSAELLWEKDLMVDEWIVKLSDGISQTISETAASELLLEDLEPGTTYMVKVAHLCGADTSGWVEAEFTTGGIACDPITNLTVSEITRQSARLTWEGSAQNYRIRIRPTSDKAAAWTYFEVKDAQTYVLENLLKLTEYEGGVQSICGMAVSDTSEYVPFEPFTTLDLTCFVPTAVVAKTIDHQSASVTWSGDADKYQVQWSVRNSGVVSGEMLAEEDKATISGLTAETNYQVRVRSICAAGDTSEWSDYSVFKTDVMPPCPTPTNLRVESVTTNSAKLLWDMSEEVNFFILRYRAASETVWDSVKDLEEKNYELTDLEPSTAYIWSVMTQCVDGRYSGWGTQNRFETEEKVGNESVDNSGLFITTSMNQIHLMNPSAIQIDRVKVYGTDGKLLEDYVIGSNENVILTTACRTRVVIVVVESQGTCLRFKTLLP